MRDLLYKLLRASNDVRALRRGRVRSPVARRVYGKATGQLARRAYGKATGRLARRLFR